MSIRDKQLQIVKSAGQTYSSVADAFNLSPNVSSAKLGRGITSIKDLVKLCEFCEARIFIETKDGQIIPITIDDL